MKHLSMFIAFLLIFSIVGCGTVDTPIGNESTHPSIKNTYIYKESDKCFKVSAMGYDLEANSEQSNSFRAIWNTLEWKENANWDSYNYWFNDGEIYMRYDSSDGILYDSTNNRHAILSEETNAEIKALIKELSSLQSRSNVIE